VPLYGLRVGGNSALKSYNGLGEYEHKVIDHAVAYVDGNEQCFRFNNRATKDNPLNDADRFTFAMSHIAGKQLTYAELRGKMGETEN
jgi:hypothetical protein